MTFAAANALVQKETWGNLHGAQDCLEAIYAGLQLPINLALPVEAKYFARCLSRPQAQAMLNTIFLYPKQLAKGARRPKHIDKHHIKTLGFIGAGFMGSGIAYVAAFKNIKVILVDTSTSTLENAFFTHELLGGDGSTGKLRTHKLLVVSSPYHLPRCLMYFRRFFLFVDYTCS